MSNSILVLFFFGCGLLLLSACSHTSEQTVSQPSVEAIAKQPGDNEHLRIGRQISNLAKTLVGKPYRYGGASPKGFDCSGLVYYTHGKQGIHTPRTSHQQYNSAKSVRLSQLESGDVVFFKLNAKTISHVGIYIGQGQFVHAPKTGQHVSTNRLSDPFWQSRIVAGGRLY